MVSASEILNVSLLVVDDQEANVSDDKPETVRRHELGPRGPGRETDAPDHDVSADDDALPRRAGDSAAVPRSRPHGRRRVVHLPRERVLFTGDLQLNGLSYMGDSYPLEWAATLEKLKALEFDTILPAHGMPFKDRARIDYFQA